MKRKLTLFTFFACTAFAVMAQTPAPRFSIPVIVKKGFAPSTSLSGKKAGLLADSSDFFTYSAGHGVFSQRQVFAYNANGDFSTLWIKDNTGAVTSRIIYTYTAANKLLTELTEKYQSGTYVPDTRSALTYDAKGNVTLDASYAYDVISSTWTVTRSDSFQYTYGANNRIEAFVNLSYDENTGTYVENTRGTYTLFNAQDLPGTGIIEQYSSNNWKNLLKLEYTTWKLGFNALNPAPTSYFGYSDNLGTWQLEAYDSTFVLAGKNYGNLQLGWTGSNFDTAQKKVITYDHMGNKYEELNYGHSSQGFELFIGSRDSSEYGAHDEMTKVSNSIFVYSDNAWKDNFYRLNYFSRLGISNPAAIAVKTYPNPFTDLVQVVLPYSGSATLRLYTLNGKLVKELNTDIVTNVPTAFPTAEIASGCYVLQVSTSAGTATVKLVK